MWNRSYHWQRQVRIGAGVAVLVALAVTSIALARTAAARRARAGAEDLFSELRSPARQRIDVKVPLSLGARQGTLVYREREDGVVQVIGRVVGITAVDPKQVELAIRLSASAAGSATHGGVLKGAPAELDFRDAVRLLLSPNTPEEEARRARDTIWPSVEKNLLPEIMEGLVREISADLANPGPEDEALLQELVDNLRDALQPLEDSLVDRLARRAWEVVGVQGLASGVWRTTLGDVINKGMNVPGWWGRLLGRKVNGEIAEQPFLSEETSRELRTALEAEVIEFWRENRAKIIDAIVKAFKDQRQDFETAFRQRWADMIYDRVIVSAWQSGQDKVLAALQAYVSDFADRRLLTRQGGPRLLFAFVLRGYLEISLSPLLILAPNETSNQVVYEPLLR